MKCGKDTERTGNSHILYREYKLHYFGQHFGNIYKIEDAIYPMIYNSTSRYMHPRKILTLVHKMIHNTSLYVKKWK